MNRRSAVAARLVPVLLALAPCGARAQEPVEPAEERRGPTTLGVDYTFSNFGGDIEAWHLVAVSAGRRTRAGSVIARANYAHRFGENGVQVEADAYPKIAPGAYGYLNAGYSRADIFPAWRFGGEAFTSLGGGWEASAGARHLRFESTRVTLYTGSVGKYLGNYWLSLRPYVRPSDGDISTSASLTARRYFQDGDNYVGARIGYGSTPGDRLTPNELSRTQSASAALQAARRIAPRVYGTGSLGYDREELGPGLTRNRVELQVGISVDP